MKEPREVLTMIPNEKGFELSNTEATGSKRECYPSILVFSLIREDHGDNNPTKSEET